MQSTKPPPQHTPLFSTTTDPEHAKRPATIEDLERLMGHMLDLLQARSGNDELDDETHREHHRWVLSRIEREKARARFWNALAERSLPGMAWGLVAAAAAGAWAFFSTHLQWSK